MKKLAIEIIEKNVYNDKRLLREEWGSTGE